MIKDDPLIFSIILWDHELEDWLKGSIILLPNISHNNKMDKISSK